MLEYLLKAAATWLIGFAPQLEVYLAVPAAKAMGLDWVSAVAWAVAGNFSAVIVTLVSFQRITSVPVIQRIIEKRYSVKNQERLNRYGVWFVVAATPIVGVWVVVAMARIAGMRPAPLLVSTFASIVVYGLATALLLALGIQLFTR